MKTLASGITAQYAKGAPTLAHGIVITREDGTVYRYTSHHANQTISGNAYTGGMLDVSGIVTQASLAVANMELTTLDDGAVFTSADIKSRRWVNASFLIFRYNWNGLTDGVDNLLGGRFGEITVNDGTIVVELRGVSQKMQSPVATYSTRTCRYRLGDTRCGVDLAPHTVTGTLTNVTSNQVFRDSARTEPVDRFTEGLFTFTSGPNADIDCKCVGYAANGTFTLALPLSSDVAIGHTYRAIWGCRKRLEEDCRDTFDNVLRFGGEPHRQGINSITKGAVADV